MPTSAHRWDRGGRFRGDDEHADSFHRSARSRQRHAIASDWSSTLSIPHLSTGDMLRQACQDKTGSGTAGRTSTWRRASWCPTRSSCSWSSRRLAQPRLPARLPARRFSAHAGPGRGARRDVAARTRHAAGRWSWSCRSIPKSWSSGWPAAAARTIARRSSASGWRSTPGRRPRCRTITGSEDRLHTIDGSGTPDEVFERIKDGHRSGRAQIARTSV